MMHAMFQAKAAMVQAKAAMFQAKAAMFQPTVRAIRRENGIVVCCDWWGMGGEGKANDKRVTPARLPRTPGRFRTAA